MEIHWGGILQGSSLSPLLFLVCVNGLLSQVSDGLLLQYDTTLICSAPETMDVAVLMNSHLEVISNQSNETEILLVFCNVVQCSSLPG